jgi:hypothetical protein
MTAAENFTYGFIHFLASEFINSTSFLGEGLRMGRGRANLY